MVAAALYTDIDRRQRALVSLDPVDRLTLAQTSIAELLVGGSGGVELSLPELATESGWVARYDHRMSDPISSAFRLDHVAIAVKDLDGALSFYRDVLGMPVGGVERVEDQVVDVAFVGEEPGRIELISPFRDDTGVAKFIEKRGEGIHHIAVRVKNIDESLRALQAKGVALIDTQARTGAHGTRGRLRPSEERYARRPARAGRTAARHPSTWGAARQQRSPGALPNSLTPAQSAC